VPRIICREDGRNISAGKGEKNDEFNTLSAREGAESRVRRVRRCSASKTPAASIPQIAIATFLRLCLCVCCRAKKATEPRERERMAPHSRHKGNLSPHGEREPTLLLTRGLFLLPSA